MQKNLKKIKSETFGFTLISAFSPRKFGAALPALAKGEYPTKCGYMRAQPQKGFTLIELLVSVAIIGILIAAAIPSINSFNQNQLLGNAQKDVIALLRHTQSKALAAEVDRRFCDVSKTSLKGWYVGLGDSASSYTIFGKCVKDQSQTTSYQFNVNVFYLPQDHIFTNLPGGAGAGYIFYVMFQPASAEVWFYNQITSDNGPLNCSAAMPPDPSLCYPPNRLGLASITIKNTKTNQTKIVEVYSNGQIRGL